MVLCACLSDTSVPACKRQLTGECQKQGGVPFHAIARADQHSLASRQSKSGL